MNDAQALAQDTKREAERLRQEAEDAEMKAALAASMQKQAPAPAPPVSNGYPTKASVGPSHGYSQPQPPTNDGGYGSQPYGMGGGFDSNVMGSGGASIPTPSGADDPYSNPFE